MFHIGQWLRDLNLTVERLTQTLTRRMRPGQAEIVDDDVDESMSNNNNSKPSISIEDEIEMKKNEKISILKMLSLPETARKQQRYTLDIEYDLPKWRMYNSNILFILLINFLYEYNYI